MQKSATVILVCFGVVLFGAGQVGMSLGTGGGGGGGGIFLNFKCMDILAFYIFTSLSSSFYF